MNIGSRYSIRELLFILEGELEMPRKILAELSLSDFEHLAELSIGECFIEELRKDQIELIKDRASKKYYGNHLCEE